MLRPGHAASLTRSSIRFVRASNSRAATGLAGGYGLKSELPRYLRSRKPVSLAVTIRKPLSTSLQCYATQPGTPFDHIDKKHEKAVAQEELEPRPEQVSTTSSVHQVFHEKGVEEPEKDEDMLAGVKEDLVGTATNVTVAAVRLMAQHRKPSRQHSPSMRSLGKPWLSVWQVCCHISELHFRPFT